MQGCPGLSLHVVPGTPDSATGAVGRRLDNALSLVDPVPVFQPIIDLATGAIAGYAALSRFPHLPGAPVDEVFDLTHGVGPRPPPAGLLRVRSIRPDVLKLDRSLVSGVDSRPDLAAPGARLRAGVGPGVSALHKGAVRGRLRRRPAGHR
jgi:hypothetical protein